MFSTPIIDLICSIRISFFFFFFNDTATTEIYTLSLHDALPIWDVLFRFPVDRFRQLGLRHDGKRDLLDDHGVARQRSEEHTSELQSRRDLVCRLLLEKKKNKQNQTLSETEYMHILT